MDLFRRAGADGDFIRCILPTRQGQGGLPCPRGGFLRGGRSGRQIPRREHNVARRIGAAAAAAVTAHARAQLRRGVVELFGRTVAAHRADGGGHVRIAWLLVKIVRHPLGQWSLAIILGGGIGNLIDRVRLGYVVDMLDTMFMDFPVFNMADVFVVCGTVCALIYYLAFYSKSDEKNWGNKVDGTDPAANK